MHNPFPSIPQPSDDELAHSARVSEHLRRLIAAGGGRIGFDRFMEALLYAPGLGYYSAGKQKFGVSGDFVTAPEIGGLFGACLGAQVGEVLAETGGDILEFGAGSGALCVQVLDALADAGGVPRRYYILEPSPDLAAAQRRRIEAGRWRSTVRWIERPPTEFTGVVLANEVLDAMPVSRFRVTDQGPRWLDVGIDGDGFAWRDGAALAGSPLAALLRDLDLPLGYVSEFNPRAAAWVAGLADWLQRGVALIADYGYPRSEYYHPQRVSGTLRCFYRHHAHDDPLVLEGIQDVTAHVDFSAVAEAARGAGIEVLGYTSLAQFLVGAGLMRWIGQPPAGPEAALKLANEVKRLTLPQEMGEVFKVIALGRGMQRPLSAFRDGDRSGRLSAAAP